MTKSDPISYFQFSSNVIFVGGAMRSGTTVLHAALCTSDDSNDYIAECRFLTNIVLPLNSELDQFSLYNKYYFSTKKALIDSRINIFKNYLHVFWENLGRPRKFILKDPLITECIPLILSEIENVYAVVIFRDPCAVISSRIIMDLGFRDGSKEDSIDHYCDEYNSTYGGILRSLKDSKYISKKLKLVNYDDFVNDGDLSFLAEIGISGINASNLWDSSITRISDSTGHYSDSPLYGKKISNRSQKKYLENLEENIQRRIVERCKNTYDQLIDVYKLQIGSCE